MTERIPRILVVTSTFPRWKDDTEPSFVLDLCTYLHGRGMEIDVLAPHAPRAEKHEILNGINVYRYQYFFKGLQRLAYAGGILANLKKSPLTLLLVPFLLLFQAAALFRRLRSTDYQLIHAHWLVPQGFICAVVNCLRGKRAPALICTSHGGDLYALDSFLFRMIRKWTIKKCALVCVVSNAMKQTLVGQGIPSEKIRVLPMGIDLVNEFKPVPGVIRNSNRLIFVGRLVEKKGVNCLLDALARVVRSNPEASLLIVGDGPLRPALEAQTVNLGLSAQVSFYGSCRHDKLPALYSSAAIAVLPSTDQEGLGLVAIEAMGCECAVIASSLEGIRDVVDADTGVLVAPGEVTELAVKICFLLNNHEQRLQLSKQGQAKAVSTFDRGVTGERYFQVLCSYSRQPFTD